MNDSDDRLADEMRVTFEVDELLTFFDGFSPMDAESVFADLATGEGDTTSR
jgi:hypothetical protein